MFVYSLDTMIFKPRFSPALTAAFALCCVVASAQAQQKYHVGKINFDNLGGFTQGQLEDAAGVHHGDDITADDLSAAAQRLSDTGYFNNVGATLAGAVNNITVKFSVAPSTHNELMHAGFENFVWLTPEEIVTAIHARVPLYAGYLPEAGAATGLVEDALTQALAAKGVKATVRHTNVEPSLAHPERVMEFVVVQPSIRISNVKLSGVSKDLVPYLQKSVNATARTPFNDGLAGEQTSTAILTPLLDAGYADASLSGVAATPTVNPDESVSVVVSAALSAGDVYHVGKITFAGAPLMSADAFAAGAKLHAGDLASRKDLIATLEPLDAAYRRQGYMDVVASAAPTLDKTAHTVDYTVSVIPGEQYRVHEVTTQGLEGDAKAQADYARGFIMKPGDLYNPDYLTHFLKNNTALQALNGYSAGFKATADPTAHTVDVLITFYKGGAR
jgi:outer membrane protein assembly factor BamA